MHLASYEWGDPAGEPVVCLHGVTGHGRRYEMLAERLPGRRVIGLDLRGHGHSGWEPPWGVAQHVADLEETAAQLGLAQADWVGHSFGGLLTVELARARPDLVRKAVLLDPALHIDPAVIAGRADAVRQDVSFASPGEAVDARLNDGSVFTTPRSILEREMELHLERREDGRYRFRWSPGAVIVAWSEMARPAPAFPSCPTLVVLGARSWIPVAVPDLPHIKALTVPGGHSVLWDDFDATAGAIASFLG
jgi:lipase